MGLGVVIMKMKVCHIKAGNFFVYGVERGVSYQRPTGGVLTAGAGGWPKNRGRGKVI